MTEREFVWWLRGYIGKGDKALTQKQLKMIKTRLGLVGVRPERSEQQKVDAFAVYS